MNCACPGDANRRVPGGNAAGMLIMVFVRAGLDKFDASSEWARAFNVWGYPV